MAAQISLQWWCTNHTMSATQIQPFYLLSKMTSEPTHAPQVFMCNVDHGKIVVNVKNELTSMGTILPYNILHVPLQKKQKTKNIVGSPEEESCDA